MTEPATAADQSAVDPPAVDPSADGTAADETAADAAWPATRGIRDLPPVTEREIAAKRRGLASAYIDGGQDPDPEKTRRDEARFVRLLWLMIGLIVGISLVVTFVGLIVAGSTT